MLYNSKTDMYAHLVRQHGESSYTNIDGINKTTHKIKTQILTTFFHPQFTNILLSCKVITSSTLRFIPNHLSKFTTNVWLKLIVLGEQNELWEINVYFTGKHDMRVYVLNGIFVKYIGLRIAN